jgi:hypothetical protein
VSREHEGGRPRGELSPYQGNTSKQAETQQGRPADTPLAPFLREQQGRGERSHDERVKSFRNAILQEKRALGDLAKYHSPVKIIDAALSKQVQYIFSDDKAEKQRGEFFAPIKHAWEVIAYEHYGKGSVNSGNLERHYAGLALSTQYQRARARNKPHPEIIRLSDPLQIQILDAAAEAADIPHRKGQAAFEIPDYLRMYEQRLRKANAEWERRRR